MTAGAFILCAWWCASSPTLGAMVEPAGDGALRLGAGIDAFFPTLDAELTLGAGRGVDVTARYDTHGLLLHAFGAGARVRLADRLALSVDAEYAVFLIDSIADIEAEDAPVGGGASASIGLWRSFFAEGGAHVGVGASATVTWLDANGAAVAELDHLTFEIGAEWAGDGGTTFLRVRAVVPIAAELHPLGYFPWIVIGRAWNL